MMAIRVLRLLVRVELLSMAVVWWCPGQGWGLLLPGVGVWLWVLIWRRGCESARAVLG